MYIYHEAVKEQSQGLVVDSAVCLVEDRALSGAPALGEGDL